MIWCSARDSFVAYDSPVERVLAERRWVSDYRSVEHSYLLCDDLALLETVPRPPQWMLFWYDSTHDAS